MSDIQIYLKNGLTIIKESGSDKSEAVPVNFRIDDSRKVVYIKSADGRRSWEAAYDEILDQSGSQVDPTGSDYNTIEDYMSLNAVFSSSTGGSVDNSVAYPVYSSGEPGSSGIDFWKRPPSQYYHFGHNWRFCGISGGYTDGSGYFDIDGNTTTKALAFPEGVVCDLGRIDGVGYFLMWQIDPLVFATQTQADALSSCEAFSTTTFSSGWDMPTLTEIFNLWYQPNTNALQQLPFELSGTNGWFWTKTIQSGTSNYHALRDITIQSFPSSINTSVRGFPVRKTNILEI